MKGKKELLLAIVLVFVLPGIMMGSPQPNSRLKQETTTITVLSGETKELMDIEEYLIGVLLGEMPADFESEALKAQAVAARTFTLHSVQNGRKHQKGSICTSSTCCQAYISPEKYIADGGAISAVERMFNAVKDTSGQVILYDGALIEATYFSSSGGRTEDAQAVWGVTVPYLQSVESEEEAALHTIDVEKSEFCCALGLADGEVYIESPSYTKGAGIEKVCINGKWFSGMQLRQYLNLRSTQITFYIGKDTVQIVTKGHGHRVGMSQYGADAMAATGSDYQEILKHYYKGVTISDYKGNEN